MAEAQRHAHSWIPTRDGRRSADRGASSAALGLEVRERAYRYQTALSPLVAGALVLGAWAIALVGEGAGTVPGGIAAWAGGVSVLAVGYALICRMRRDPDTASVRLMSMVLAGAGATFGLGAAVLAAAADVAAGRLVALVAMSVAAAALPAVIVRPWMFPVLTALLLAPLSLIHLLRADGDPAVAAVLVAALPALVSGQAVLGRTLNRALRNDVEQRALLRRLEEANQTLSADRMTLQTESRTDPLTGLANRRYLEETLHAEWNRCRRSGAPLSCVMLDIDYFKAYNDHYGHDGGDACLREMAAILGDATRRAGDVVARYGGEEFVVLLPETGADGASTVADLLKRAVVDARIPHASSPIGAALTISLGVATLVPDEHRVPGELLKAADLALYEAKGLGRNRVVMADLETLDSARLAARGLIG